MWVPNEKEKSVELNKIYSFFGEQGHTGIENFHLKLYSSISLKTASSYLKYK